LLRFDAAGRGGLQTAMQDAARRRLAILALLAGATGIGFAPLLVRWSETGSTATAFHRIFLSLPVVWLWMTLEGRRSPAPPRPATRREYGLLFAAGLFFAGDLAFWHWSIRFTSVANATLLANLAPIFVTTGAAALFHERISRRFVLALLVTLAGATLLVGVSVNVSRQHLLGDLMGVITAVFYAAYQLTVKRARASFSTATILTWSGVACAPVLWLIASAGGEPLLPVSLNGWLVLLALALVSHVGGQGMIAYGFGHLPASVSSVSLLLQPVVATVLAWGLLGESITPMQVLGGGVVLAGIFVTARERR
jgi:drug/metabolite transporter (DMT)-like permease